MPLSRKEFAEALQARVDAGYWREYLEDGKVIDHILHEINRTWAKTKADSYLKTRRYQEE